MVTQECLDQVYLGAGDLNSAKLVLGWIMVYSNNTGATCLLQVSGDFFRRFYMDLLVPGSQGLAFFQGSPKP